MPDKLPREFTLSGLRDGRSNVTVITGSGIDVESGLPSFRGEKGYYEDKETTVSYTHLTLPTNREV